HVIRHLRPARRSSDLHGTGRSTRLAGLPGAGAGGGIGFGLALLGARLVPGAQLVAEAVDLAGKVAASDLVVTGEGRFDWQSLRRSEEHTSELQSRENL